MPHSDSSRPDSADRLPSQLWTTGSGQAALVAMQRQSRAGDFGPARVRLFLDTISRGAATSEKCSCPICRPQRRS